jgi:hypothetical protein
VRREDIGKSPFRVAFLSGNIYTIQDNFYPDYIFVDNVCQGYVMSRIRVRVLIHWARGKQDGVGHTRRKRL